MAPGITTIPGIIITIPGITTIPVGINNNTTDTTDTTNSAASTGSTNHLPKKSLRYTDKLYVHFCHSQKYTNGNNNNYYFFNSFYYFNGIYCFNDVNLKCEFFAVWLGDFGAASRAKYAT